MYLSKKLFLQILLIAVAVSVAPACTKKKETLVHTAPTSEEDRKAKAAEAEKKAKEEAKKKAEAEAKKKAQAKRKAEAQRRAVKAGKGQHGKAIDPASLPDLPEGAVGKTTVDPTNNTVPEEKKESRVFEKGGSSKGSVASGEQIEKMNAENEKINDRALKILEIKRIYPAGQSRRSRIVPLNSSNAEPGDGYIQSSIDEPLEGTYLPQTDELGECNYMLNAQHIDSDTGAVDERGSYFGTGRADGYMAFMKSLINCQDEVMRQASKNLAVNIDRPVVRVNKGGLTAGTGTVDVSIDVRNGHNVERFVFAGQLEDLAGLKKNYAHLTMVATTNDRYLFQGKVFCVDVDGSCENVLVMLEQLIDGRPCKRVYLMHRYGSGRVRVPGVSDVAMETETNQGKKEFMRYIYDSSRDTDECKSQIEEEGKESCTIERRMANTIRFHGYSTTAVAYGASTFELGMQSYGKNPDVIMIRGPLNIVDQVKRPDIKVEFGNPGTTLDSGNALMTDLTKVGRSRAFAHIQLFENYGDGNIGLLVYFGGSPETESLKIHFSDVHLKPVVGIAPVVIMNAK